jgi:hypothetical protein
MCAHKRLRSLRARTERDFARWIRKIATWAEPVDVLVVKR